MVGAVVSVNSVAASQGTPELMGERKSLEVAPLVQESVIHNGDMEKLIIEYFGNDSPTAIAIAKAESNLIPDRVGDKHLTWNDGRNGMSCGLFQIRVFPDRPGCEELKNPELNVRFAKKLFDKSGFSPWSTYKNNQYLSFLTQ